MSWFKDAIIYHILIDRFAGCKTEGWDSPVFLGGNIKGITAKLPYFEELGINTLWLSPFYKTSAYHGYHITDFFQVDKRFGILEDIKELISRAHETDMRIIADFVPNHCSSRHPLFLEAQRDKNSEYREWFYFTKWPHEYLCFLDVSELPKLNLDNESCREHIINAAKYWLNLGFDGFRLDHVIGPKHSFWKIFREEIRGEFADAVLIGEVWMPGMKWKYLKTVNVRRKYLKWASGGSSDKLFKEYIGELDGVLDFKFQSLAKEFVADTRELKRRLEKHYRGYPLDFFLPTFLDNHDMNRFLFECGNDKDMLKRAAQIQFSLDQPPVIYYGTEVGMSQPKSSLAFANHGDIQARMPMEWEKPDMDMYCFYKKLIRDRAR